MPYLQKSWQLFLQESLENILVKHTGKPLDVVKKDTERDFFINAEEAKEYGVVDTVITKL